MTTVSMKKFALFLASIITCANIYAQKPSNKVLVENALVETVKDLCIGGNASEAAARLEILAQRDSTNGAVFFYLGKCDFLAGKYDKSVEALERACSLEPSNEDYAEELAKVYGSVGRGRESADIYLKLLADNPGKYRNAYTLTILADQQLYSMKDSLALENYDAALMYDEAYAPAILGKSELYRMRGNTAAFFSTIKSFTTDPNIYPKPKCDYINSILEHVDGMTFQTWGAQLDSMVTDCVKAHPTDSSALKMAGKWFFSIGEKERARKYFSDFLQYYPESIEPHFINLQLLAMDDDMEGMIAECQAILKITEGDGNYEVSAMSTLGDCYYQSGQKETAYSWYEKALKIKPDYLPVLNNYAYYLSFDGKKLQKALKMSKTTVEKEPDNPTYLDTYGWLLHLRGKDKEAKPYFKHAMLYGGKENKEVLWHYSEVLRALGENDLSDYYRDLSEKKQ